MTDRVNSLLVVLDADMREDDVAQLADAIRCFRGVGSVLLNVSDVAAHVAVARARVEIKRRIYAALDEHN